MNVNWEKIDQVFKKADEAFKLMGEAITTDVREDKPCGKDMWQFQFSKLPWRMRLKTGWVFFKASLSIVFLGRGKITLRKK